MISLLWGLIKTPKTLGLIALVFVSGYIINNYFGMRQSYLALQDKYEQLETDYSALETSRREISRIATIENNNLRTTANDLSKLIDDLRVSNQTSLSYYKNALSKANNQVLASCPSIAEWERDLLEDYKINGLSRIKEVLSEIK